MNQQQKVTYDPQISGYDETFWKTLNGTPAVSGTKLRLTCTGATQATETFTLTGAVSDGETVTIGSEVYEFDTDASVTEGNILVDVSGGATAPDAVTALVAAITSDSALVTAVDGTGDTVDVTAIEGGTAGNDIEVSTDAVNGSWGDTNLSGGLDNGAPAEIVSYYQLVAGKVELALNVPTAPTAGDRREFGVMIPSFGSRSYAQFLISGATLTCTAYGSDGSTLVSREVTWDGDWTATETKFAVVFTPSSVAFYVGGVKVASYNSEQDVEMSRIDEAVAVHVKNGATDGTNADNLDMGAVLIESMNLIV